MYIFGVFVSLVYSDIYFPFCLLICCYFKLLRCSFFFFTFCVLCLFPVVHCVWGYMSYVCMLCLPQLSPTAWHRNKLLPTWYNVRSSCLSIVVLSQSLLICATACLLIFTVDPWRMFSTSNSDGDWWIHDVWVQFGSRLVNPWRMDNTCSAVLGQIQFGWRLVQRTGLYI